MQARSGELAGRWLGTKDAAANIEPHCFKRLGSPEWYRILTHIPSNCRAPKEPYRILTCVFSQDWAPMGAVSNLGPYPFKQEGPEGPSCSPPTPLAPAVLWPAGRRELFGGPSSLVSTQGSRGLARDEMDQAISCRSFGSRPREVGDAAASLHWRSLDAAQRASGRSGQGLLRREPLGSLGRQLDFFGQENRFRVRFCVFLCVLGGRAGRVWWL